MKKNKTKNFVLNIIAILLIFVFVFPIIVLIVSSFKPKQEIFDLRLIPKTFTLDNYITIFKEENLLLYIKNSFVVACTITVVALFLHAMAGYSFAKLKFKGKNFLFFWILSTYMIPFSVIMIPLFIIVQNLGLVNSLSGVIIPLIPNAYGIFLYRQYFLELPDDIIESAKIDGLSDFGIFFRIALPLAKSITFTLGVAFFVVSWNNYLWPLIVAQEKHLWLIQIAISNFKGERGTEWNLILASSCIAALPTIIIFFMFQRFIVEGIKMAGIKG